MFEVPTGGPQPQPGMQCLYFSSLAPQDSCQLDPQVFFEGRGKPVSFPEGPLITFNVKKKKKSCLGETVQDRSCESLDLSSPRHRATLSPGLSPLLVCSPGAVDGAAGGCCVD